MNANHGYTTYDDYNSGAAAYTGLMIYGAIPSVVSGFSLSSIQYGVSSDTVYGYVLQGYQIMIEGDTSYGHHFCPVDNALTLSNGNLTVMNSWTNNVNVNFYSLFYGDSVNAYLFKAAAHECNHKGGYAGISSEHPHYDRYYCSICGKDSPATSTEHEHYVDSCSVCNPTHCTLSYDIVDGGAVITGYTGTVSGALTIPAQLGGYLVREIGDWAFSSCTGLTSVVIPQGVTSIGRCAFYGCTGLIDISVPDSVNTIGGGAFLYCTGLTAVTLPEGVAIIGDSAFGCCTGLTSVTIPDSVTDIVYYAFSDCSSLTTITVPDSVTAIESGVFEGCSSLTSIAIPDGVTVIGGNAFSNCTGLTGITLPDSVTEIVYEAFSGCSNLASITIPDNVTSIGQDAFYGTAYLNNVDNWQNHVLYMGNHVIQAEEALSGNYAIRQGTRSIADCAFEDCSGITAVTVPDGVVGIGAWAFAGCNALQSIALPNSVKTIGAWAFQHCDSLETIAIPHGITAIEGGTFYYCSGLTSITLPDTITVIEGNAFSNCSQLTEIVLPDSVTEIVGTAFSGCSRLAHITIPDSVTCIGYDAFYGTACYNAESNWRDQVLYIGKHLIAAKETLSGEYTVADDTRTIAGYAFFQCAGLTGIVLPDSVVDIGSSAFSDCTGLSTVDILSDTVTIHSDAFPLACTIRCQAGSTAEAFAKAAGIAYELVTFTAKDAASGVTVKNKDNSPLDKDTELTVQEVTDHNMVQAVQQQLPGAVLYLVNMTLMKNGAAVSPTQELLLSMPVPAGMQAAHCTVYAPAANGALTELTVTCRENTLVFAAAGLGTYVIAEERSSLLGDIDRNGKVNMKDYGLLQQYLNGWDVDIDRIAVDVNGDGKINMKDLSLLQQYLNGWDVELG